MNAHVLVDDMLMSRSGEILQEINRLLRSKYGIEHTTIQLECENCQGGFYCDIQTGCVSVTRRSDHENRPHSDVDREGESHGA
jgi:cobalt-zinc-cadmium efflux system protein